MQEFNDDKTRTHVVLSKGTMVSDYRIVEKIGAGGMGEVYLAKDTQLDRKVALKFLPPHLCADEECRARFKREAQAAAKLSHPNIITIHEVSDYQGRPFIAMEHVEGRSLREFAAEEEFSIERILEIGIQVCEALNEAHEHGIIHRDVKPTNILIDSHGRAKIVDFGLASVVGKDQLTKTGSTMGTVGYMSPEQVMGQAVDHRSDLFSIGVVLYELITRQNPFKRETEAATLRAVSDDLPEPMARFKSGLPDGLQAIVDKALEKDTRTRYQHADGMLSDLMRVKRLVESASPIAAAATPAGRSMKGVWIAAIVVIVVVGLLVIRPWESGTVADSSDKMMLAVLPFENLGNPEDEYFADGITDEITSRLATIHSLGVISRTSAYAYKNSDKTLPEIAAALGADYILEGTIRWDKTGDTDQVRITPQLIRVADDVHLWADNYDKAITRIFDVQIDIATRIVEALGVTMLAGERQSLAYEPTENLEAYDYYLRAMEYWDELRDLDLASLMLNRAIEADSTFSAAYALLAQIHGFTYFNRLDRSEEAFTRFKEAAENAEKYSDGGIDGYFAMGYFHYYGARDYDRALEYFTRALELQPNNTEVLTSIAHVQRRQGKWDEAVANYSKAYQMNPHALRTAHELVGTLSAMRRYEEVDRICDRVINLAPNVGMAYFVKAQNWLLLTNDTVGVRELLEEGVRYGDPDMAAWYLEIFDFVFKDFETAITRRTVPGSFAMEDSSEFYLAKAAAYHFLGRDSISRIYYDSARMVSEGRLEFESLTPNDAFDPITLARAYAGLGRKEDAIRYGTRAMELLPVSEDALYGPYMISEMSYIYVMVGEYELAIDQLEYLMSIPSDFGLYDLHHSRQLDPLRDHPRFKALIEKYEKEQGN